jgi:hypothetical protein
MWSAWCGCTVGDVDRSAPGSTPAGMHLHLRRTAHLHARTGSTRIITPGSRLRSVELERSSERETAGALMTTTTKPAETAVLSIWDENRLAAAAQHTARQTGIDKWLSVAYQHLHDAIAEHATCTKGRQTSPLPPLPRRP